jgi:flagellar biosynthesis component FlhA
LFIHAPLEFSAFPTVLLIATMLRLALNLASTPAHSGARTRGHRRGRPRHRGLRPVMGGNFVIGIIVFTILVIVNFVVITSRELPKEQSELLKDIVPAQITTRNLAMQPSKLTEFINLVREKFEQAARDGEAPVLVTSRGIRPFVRGIIERFRAQTSVLAQSKIHPRARLKTVASI